ncbi:MAG TPA: hypothetical protein VF235_06235 [Actinomycetota bacterium]
MPTYDRTRRFDRDYAALSPEDRARVKAALRKFLEDLPTGRFRPGLRVKGIQGADGIFEMSWAGDGRATFEYGDEHRPGEPHIVWRRIGGHGIFADP